MGPESKSTLGEILAGALVVVSVPVLLVLALPQLLFRSILAGSRTMIDVLRGVPSDQFAQLKQVAETRLHKLRSLTYQECVHGQIPDPSTEVLLNGRRARISVQVVPLPSDAVHVLVAYELPFFDFLKNLNRKSLIGFKVDSNNVIVDLTEDDLGLYD